VTSVIPLHVGFSGPRSGLSINQIPSLANIFSVFGDRYVVFHHGDATGADSQACKLAVDFGFILHSHPSEIERYRAYFPSDVVEEPLPPLVRNNVIVRAVRLLVACPDTFHEVRRSGTWTTIRLARSVKRSRLLVWPDGKVRYEREQDLQLH
jgi:hypothetical protein